MWRFGRGGKWNVRLSCREDNDGALSIQILPFGFFWRAKSCRAFERGMLSSFTMRVMWGNYTRTIRPKVCRMAILTFCSIAIAFGQSSDVTAEAAGAVIFESSLERVDELLHIGRRMRAIALQSAVGGMVLSTAGMLIAAAGFLPPVAGAITQEAIDVLSVLNALRALLPPRVLTDYEAAGR